MLCQRKACNVHRQSVRIPARILGGLRIQPSLGGSGVQFIRARVYPKNLGAVALWLLHSIHATHCHAPFLCRQLTRKQTQQGRFARAFIAAHQHQSRITAKAEALKNVALGIAEIQRIDRQQSGHRRHEVASKKVVGGGGHCARRLLHRPDNAL